MSLYHLAADLSGAHTQDVRAVFALSSRSIVSASRDATAKVWVTDKTEAWNATRTIPDKDGRFVSSITCATIGGQPFIALGSGSGAITCWSATDASADPITLRGHASNVCALDGDESGLMVSGSWDKTAIIWRDGKVTHTIQHKEAVWAVAIAGDKVLTGSADKTIQLSDVATGKVLRTFTGHTDCVRAICVGQQQDGDAFEFWSAGNDANVLQWTSTSSTPLAVLSGHTSFIYSIAALPTNGGIATSGEDGTVRVWERGACVQTIVHPTVSVWDVTTLPNGDIVTGSSDGAIRVFSRDDSRKASDEVTSAWMTSVQNRQINKAQVGDIKHTDLAGPEALAKPGQKEGQVLMIKNNGKVEAYQWQAAASTWQQIGEVVDAVGSGRKQLYKGVEYDYVFDVDIKEGAPPLKLPYNANENPFAAAERFLNVNDLPLSYVDQVVQFLTTNTGGAQIGGGGGYQDPFTGAGAYHGGGSAATTSAYRDPFTGAGGYQPSAPSGGATGGGGGGGRDPYTGTGAYSSGGSSKTFAPIKTPQRFTTINVMAAQNKINEFAQELPLSSSEKVCLDEIWGQLNLPAAAQDGVQERWDVETLLGLLRWPVEKRFPGESSHLVECYGADFSWQFWTYCAC